MNLEVRDGCFGYGNRTILKDISFKVGEKQIMTVLGPNGVGKTTMLKCIMGFLKWTSGDNFLDGRKISSYTDKEFWKKTSYVPQAKKSVFSYRCIDMVVMGLSSRQNFFETPSRRDYEKAESVMEMLGYNHKKLIGKTADIVNEENIEKFFNVCSKIVSFSISSEEYKTIFPYKVAK